MDLFAIDRGWGAQPVRRLAWGLALAALTALPAGAQELSSPDSLEARLRATEARLQQLEAQRLPAVETDEVARLRSQLQQAQSRLQALEARRLPPTQPASLRQNGDENGNGNGEDTEDTLKKLTERLEEVEDSVESHEKAMPTIVRSGTKASTMQVTGRVHADWWSFPDTSPGANAMETEEFDESPQDRIGFRRLRFGVKGDVLDYMNYKIEMEFAGGNDVEFRDAWLGFNEMGIFETVLIGNQKRPYGLDHLNSSRYNVFMERPFFIEAVNQDARRLGIASYGYSDDLRYNWRYGVWNLRNVQDEGLYISDDYQMEVAGRLASTVWYDESSEGRGYLHLGLSGSIADPSGALTDNTDTGPAVSEARFRTRPEARSSQRWIDTGVIPGADWYELAGLESVLNLGPLQITGEYMNVWMQRESGFDDTHFQGAYVYVSYFLTGEYMPWSREDGTLARPKPYENFWLVDTCHDGTQAGWGAWQVAVRYSYADFNSQDIFGGVGQSMTVGLNWYWNPNARMQFNWIHGQIDDVETEVASVDQIVSGNYDILGARWMIDF